MNVLIIAAHPDDEVLGCGGTILKIMKKTGNKLYFAYACDGVMGRYNLSCKEKHLKEIEKRKRESIKVSQILNGKILNQEPNYYPFEDQRLNQADYNHIVGWISKIIAKAKPEIIFTHFIGDFNIDHRIISEAVMIAARPSKFEFIKKIIAFEVNMIDSNQGKTIKLPDFSPNIFEKMDSKTFKEKLKLFSYYKSEHWPTWKEDIDILAKYYGTNSGMERAEAFELIRQYND